MTREVYLPLPSTREVYLPLPSTREDNSLRMKLRSRQYFLKILDYDRFISTLIDLKKRVFYVLYKMYLRTLTKTRKLKYFD